ncbi:MAG: metallophosphoesterase, partial [Spirochaetes bacterium]|nr:metallophosphoesterase [Spirochaetota bacterium]
HDYDEKTQKEVKAKIAEYQAELHRLAGEKKNSDLHPQLYSENIVVPCLFNSGCAIGKKGITCLEIDQGKIALIHWYDQNKRSKSTYSESEPKQIAGTSFYRTVLKTDTLDYLFTKIKLLS